jgi:hypothetical protein
MTLLRQIGKPLFAVSFAIGAPLLSAQSNFQTVPSLVPVQTILTVEARHDNNKNVPALKREDVMAYERQERFEVSELVPLTGENAGMELFLLIDDASSTSLGSQLGDLRGFIETQPAATAVGVSYMRNGTVETLQNLTTDHGRAAQALRLPQSSGGAMASPYLSLSDLIKRWPGNSSRREVVMVTSGVDPLGGLGPLNPYLDAAIRDAQRHNIVVYAIYMPAAGHAGHSFFLMNWAQNHLAQLTEETGGEAYMLGFGSPVSLAPYLEEICGHLAHQYRVTLLVKPDNRAGFRDVRFATEVPNAEVVAATQVYVPAAWEEPSRSEY